MVKTLRIVKNKVAAWFFLIKSEDPARLC